MNKRQLQAREAVLMAELDRRRTTSERQADYVLRSAHRTMNDEPAEVEATAADTGRHEERPTESTSERQARFVISRNGRGWSTR